MVTVLVTRIWPDKLGNTVPHDFDDLAAANEYADRLRTDGLIVCVKVGKRIKRVL